MQTSVCSTCQYVGQTFLGRTGVEQHHICLYTLWLSHTHNNVFGSTPHAFKNPSKTVKQTLSIWQPLCDCGTSRTKAPHSCLGGNLSCAHCLSLLREVLKFSLHAPVHSKKGAAGWYMGSSVLFQRKCWENWSIKHWCYRWAKWGEAKLEVLFYV